MWRRNRKGLVAGEVSRNEVEQPSKRALTVPTEQPDNMIQAANEPELYRVLSRRVGKSYKVTHCGRTWYGSREAGPWKGGTSRPSKQEALPTTEHGGETLPGNSCVPCTLLHSCYLAWDLSQLSYEQI